MLEPRRQSTNEPAGTSPVPRLCRLADITLAGRRRPRLDRVSLEFHVGATAVLGWSGAGKTSLLNVLVGFERPESGTCSWEIPSDHRRLPLFWAPPDDGLWPHFTVERHLTEAMPSTAAGAERAAELLDGFGLDALREARPGRLSQGERARLAVARALAADAAVLVMDEPLAHVDPARVAGYRDFLADDCRRRDTSLVFATHSPEMALTIAERVVCLDDGRVLFTGPLEALYHRPPTAALAAFLGPANWLEPDDARLWPGLGRDDAACLRPERVSLEPISSEPSSTAQRLSPAAIVESSRSAGAITHTDLRCVETDARRRWHHRTPSSPLRPGDSVIVRADFPV